jgi:curved DNA-binding protein
MDEKNYYQILGLSPDATPAQVKKAFKDQAKKYHPDRNPGDKVAEDKFKAANEAHDVLSDPKKRRLYDKAGENWRYFYDSGQDPDTFRQNVAGNRGNGSYRFTGDAGDFMGGNLSDIMEEIFGGFGSSTGFRPDSGPRKGQDYEGRIDISLEEACRGTERILELNQKKLRVRLKPGIADGKTIRIKGKGAPGQAGGPAGDLFLRVTVLPHPTFRRKGKDLYTEVTADVYTCILGGKLRIHTLDREVDLDIPAGTSPDRQLRMRGMGMPDYGGKGAPGDLLVSVKVKLPVDLSEREKALFRELRSLKKD